MTANAGASRFESKTRTRWHAMRAARFQLACSGLLLLVLQSRAGEPTNNSVLTSPVPKPFQRVSPGPPPQSPGQFNPDAGVTPTPMHLFTEEDLKLRLRVSTNAPPVPKTPAQFNPDPGAWLREAPSLPLFDTHFGLAPTYGLSRLKDRSSSRAARSSARNLNLSLRRQRASTVASPCRRR